MPGGGGPRLEVHEEVRQVFRDGCNADHPYRWIQLEVDADKEAIHLGETGTADENSTMEQDFANIRRACGAAETDKIPTKPCFILLREKDSSSWTLISFVPTDTTKPKLRMLYPTCKEGLKKELGTTWFQKDYQATEAEELTFQAFNEWKEANTLATPEDLLSDRERAHNQEVCALQILLTVATLPTLVSLFYGAENDLRRWA